MDERVIQFRVGVVLLASAIITVALVMFFGARRNLLQKHYEVNVQFVEAPGITVDTPVRKSGVLIGRVSAVELRDEGGVLVTAKIGAQYKLRQHEFCRIGTGSILGDAVLEFVPSSDEDKIRRFDRNGNKALDADERTAANELIGDGDFLAEGAVSSNPLRVLVNLEDNIRGALGAVQAAGTDVSDLARTVNQTVGGNKDQIQQLMQKTERALDSFDKTMGALQSVLGDEEFAKKLETALRDLPEFLAETRQTMAAARDTMIAFQRVSQKAETNLDNIESFTTPLRETGGQLVQNLNRSTDNLNKLLSELAAFSEALNQGQGTLGKLVREDELYTKVQRVVANAEELTQRMRPILDDVRVFTDKIARDPRQLGVSGALDRRPTGLKQGVPW